MRFIASLALFSVSAAATALGQSMASVHPQLTQERSPKAISVDQSKTSAPASSDENETPGESVDIPPNTPEEYEAEELIKRYGVLLEELKQEVPLEGEGKPASRESQIKWAKILADQNKPVMLKDETVRDEFDEFMLSVLGHLELGGPKSSLIMLEQLVLYRIANEINNFAQMSLEEQADNMETLHSLGKRYSGSPQLPRELDTTEFLKAGDTLARLQVQYSRSLHEFEAGELVQRFEELLEDMKKEALSGEGNTAPRELQLKIARFKSDYINLLNVRNPAAEIRDELIKRIQPSIEAVDDQYHKMGALAKFPIMITQSQLYGIVNRINRLAQRSAVGQNPNIRELVDLGRNYPAFREEAEREKGLDRAEFDEAGETLRQLQARYPQSQN